MPEAFDLSAIYFAGGYYHPVEVQKCPNGIGEIRTARTDKPKSFEAVRPTVSYLPYITRSPSGLKLTRHHANLYKLSDDGKTAHMVRYTCREVAKFDDEQDETSIETDVVLPEHVAVDLRRSIERGFYL